MNLLALIPWYWRLLALVALVAAAYGAGWVRGLVQETEKFDAYRAEVKLAGDKQNFLTQQTIKAHQTLQEQADAEAKSRTAERDAALARMRVLVQAGRDSRVVPAAPAGAAGGDRICFAREELNRGLVGALDRLRERSLANAEEGQRSADVAAVCRDWTKGLQ